MDVKVRYDDGLSSGELLFANQPGDDLGRHEMGADRDVGLMFFKKLDQRASVEPRKRRSEQLVFCPLLSFVVIEAIQGRHCVHHIDVRFRVEPAKERVGVVECFDAMH